MCNAYNIAQDHVYYFSEYRTSSNKVPERKRQWNELVANYSVGHLAPVTQSRQHALAGPAALDDSVQSVAKEISMIVRSHELAHNRTERERLMTLLKSAEFRSPEFTLLMDQFFSPDASIPELSKEEALELELLIKQTWPCLRWVTAERLSLLQKGIREASVTISSADSYSFISFGCFHLINNKDAKKFILELFPQIQSTTETESQDVPPPLRSKSKVSNMLKAIATRLKDILNTSLVTLHEIDQRHGNMVISLPPELVYQRLSHVTDVNSLRSLMDQAVRYSIREPQKQLDRVCNISKSLLDHIGQTVAELDGDAAST